LTKIRGLAGKLVKVTVTPHKFEITEATEDEESAWLQEKAKDKKKKGDIKIVKSLSSCPSRLRFPPLIYVL